MAASWTYVKTVVSRFKGVTFPANFPSQFSHFPDEVLTLEMSIGEHMAMDNWLSCNADLRGNTVQFFPSLFSKTQNTPSIYFYFQIPIGATGGQSFQGIFSCGTLPVKNHAAFLTLQTVGASTTFIITYYFYATADTNGYFVCYDTLAPGKRFLKNSQSNPIDLNNNDYGDYFHSVGGTGYANGFYRYGMQATDLSNVVTVPFKEFPKGTLFIKGRFYGVDFDNAANTITQQGNILLFDSAGLTPFTNLSLHEDVKVQWDVDFDTETPKGAVVYLIRTDSYNNGDFITDYDTQEVMITTVVGASTLGLGIKSPSKLWESIGGDIYRCEFYIDKTHLVAGGKYRMILIVYTTDDSELVSLISPEYNTTEFPSCTEIVTSNVFKDVVANVANSRNVAVQERLIVLNSSTLTDTTNYINAVKAKTDPGVIITPDRLTFEIFSESNNGGITKKDVFETETVYFGYWAWSAALSKFYASFYTSGNWGFINPNDFFYSADGNTLQQWNRILYHFRVRYEADIPNVATYLDEVLQATPAENQNWANRTLYLKLKVRMKYSWGITVYFDEHTYQFKMVVRDFENNQLTPKLTNAIFTKVGGAAIENICSETDIEMRATKDAGLAAGALLIGFLDNQSYGIQNLRENYIFVDDVDFPAIQDATYISPDATWAATGKMLIHFDQLPTNLVWRGSLMYKGS